jgi:glycosyltransferase involved in cell wall biosynthesis
MNEAMPLILAEQLRLRVSGGIGTYIRGLTSGLVELGAHATLYASRGPGLDLGLPERHARFGQKVTPHVWQAGLDQAPEDFHIVHASSWLTVKPRPSQAMSVFAHDLLWRDYPKAFTPHGVRWHEKALGRAIARANVFCCPSKQTADALVKSGISASAINIIPHGVDHLSKPDFDALEQLKLSDRFFLSVSTIEPRKNLARAIAAYEHIHMRDPSVGFVVCGPQGWGEQLNVPAGVHLLGAVPPATLSALYSRALALVFVPLAEGFGLPVAEAQSLGCPVIASAVPSAGNAALIVDPMDEPNIASAMRALVGDDARCAEMAAAGIAETEGLTWARSAAEHIAVWESLNP